MKITTRESIAEDTSGTGRADTFGTHTWWLVTSETTGAGDIVLNVGTLPPGTAHVLHRHAHAEQVVYVVRGRGEQLRPGESPVPVGEGTAIHVPRGEWHGFANPYDQEVTIISVYGGIGRREDAGYELYEVPDPLPETTEGPR